MREFDLLDAIYEANSRLGHKVLIPPGDDMAMVQLRGRELLAAVDQIVDGVHFRLAATPVELVGRKAVTRSLNDIAAMAARPVATLVAATLPRQFNQEAAAALFEAMRATAEHYECPLIGGDLAFHSDPAGPLVCGVTVLAEPAAGPPICRRGARAGDRLYVTGALGGSLEPSGGGRHLTFEPRIPQAIWLAERLGDRLHAMIDLSDGLGRDASHMAKLSEVQIRIDTSEVPCTPGCDWQAAISDGEDYELCFAASGEVPSRTPDGVPITTVGEVRPRDSGGSSSPAVIIRHEGREMSGEELGWQHQT